MGSKIKVRFEVNILAIYGKLDFYTSKVWPFQAIGELNRFTCAGKKWRQIITNENLLLELSVVTHGDVISSASNYLRWLTLRGCDACLKGWVQMFFNVLFFSRPKSLNRILKCPFDAFGSIALVAFVPLGILNKAQRTTFECWGYFGNEFEADLRLVSREL